MYTFTRAPTFISSSEVTAKDISKVADAFNDRIKSGIGDCSRRIHIGIMNSMRNIRNPLDEFTFPSQMESLTFYNHVSPSSDEFWPTADRGEPEGANLANPVSAFVFGNPQLYGEADIISSLLEITPLTNTVYNTWLLAANQRGGIDTASMAVYQPFNSASQEHFRIVAAPWQFYLKSPGGYLPSPAIIGTCTDSLTDPTVVFPNQQFKFKRLSDGFTVTYSGTCGPSYGGSSTDVADIADLPFKWVVYLYDGTIDEYPKAEWIQLLEGAGVLQKDNFDFLNRTMLNNYVKEFKGSQAYSALNIIPDSSPYPISKSACYNILSHSFDFENVINRPWQLSPAYATADISGNLDINYPSTSLSTDQTATPTVSVMFPNPYTIHDNFVLGGYFVRGTNLSQSATIQMMADGKVITEFTLQTGSADDPLIYEDCNTIGTKVTGSISFALISDLKFKPLPSSSVYIEISELYEAYPQIYDLYCLLRCSSTLGIIEIDSNDDRFGVDESQATTIFNNYCKYGGAININGAAGVDQPESTINTNPPVESLRKFVRSISRYIKKENLTGYEVQDGKSILYFKRYLDEENTIDMWDGLLNPFDSGSNGIILNNTGSWSNEWVMDIGLKPTNPSISSIWKDDAYYWWGINRALFLNSIIPGNYSDTFNFVQDGGSNFIAEGDLLLTNPEYGITYLNYDKQVNTIGGETPQPTEDFYKSCQVYPECYYITEIKAVEGNEVKITFNKRFQHHEDEAESFTRVTSSWSATDINNESYRTDSNAIRQYLIIDKDLDNHAIGVKTGDHAARNDYDIFTDQPNGMIPETFLFLKLMPKPYSGSKSLQCVCNDEDKTVISSEFLIQSEFYLRSICEGFVDEFTPFSCSLLDDSTSTAYDFTYPNLCYNAFTGSHMTFPRRTDNGTAYGTLPTMVPYASTLNQISSCLNLLRKARLPLPFKLETKTCNYRGDVSSGVTYINGSTCNGSFVSCYILGNSGPAATTLTDCGEWEELVPDLGGNLQFGAGTSAGWTGLPGGCNDDDPTKFIITSTRQTVEYRFQLTDPLSINCISSELYDNFINGTNGFFGELEDFLSYYQAYQVSDGPSSFQTCLCGGVGTTTIFYNSDTGFGLGANEITSDTTKCVLFSNGKIDLGPSAPSSDMLFCIDKGCEPDASSGTGGGISQAVRVKNTNTSIIVIPLVD